MDKKRIQRILEKSAAEMVGLILAALGGVLNVIGVISVIPSSFIIFLGIGVFVFFTWRKIYQFLEKIDAFDNSRPNLERTSRGAVFPVNPIGGVTTTTTTTSVIHFSESYEWLEGSQLPGLWRDPTSDLVDYEKDNQGWFALVEFINKPIEPIDKSVAREVSAHIFYYGKDNKYRISKKGISGRWWSNEEVALSNKPRRELERTTIFPNSQPATLALAYMGVKDSVIYGYNNDNHEYKEFKKDEFSLGLGSYYIHVILSGINLKPQNYWFLVWKDKQSRELKIKDIENPKGIKDK